MEQNILLVTVGLPRSGKTTYAQQQRAKGAVVVNPDSIRLALHGHRFIGLAEDFVWAIAKTMVRALFEAGHTRVVVDATNTTKKRRDFWKDDSWRRQLVSIGTTLDVCMDRAKASNDAEIIPVIERMAAQFEAFTEDEQKEAIYLIKDGIASGEESE